MVPIKHPAWLVLFLFAWAVPVQADPSTEERLEKLEARLKKARKRIEVLESLVEKQAGLLADFVQRLDRVEAELEISPDVEPVEPLSSEPKRPERIAGAEKLDTAEGFKRNAEVVAFAPIGDGEIPYFYTSTRRLSAWVAEHRDAWTRFLSKGGDPEAFWQAGTELEVWSEIGCTFAEYFAMLMKVSRADRYRGPDLASRIDALEARIEELKGKENPDEAALEKLKQQLKQAKKMPPENLRKFNKHERRARAALKIFKRM